MHIGYRGIIRARVLKKHQFRGKTDWPVPAPPETKVSRRTLTEPARIPGMFMSAGRPNP